MQEHTHSLLQSSPRNKTEFSVEVKTRRNVLRVLLRIFAYGIVETFQAQYILSQFITQFRHGYISVASADECKFVSIWIREIDGETRFASEDDFWPLIISTFGLNFSVFMGKYYTGRANVTDYFYHRLDVYTGKPLNKFDPNGKSKQVLDEFAAKYPDDIFTQEEHISKLRERYSSVLKRVEETKEKMTVANQKKVSDLHSKISKFLKQ